MNAMCRCGVSDAEGALNLSSFLKVLVLGNKRDLPNALDEKQLIEKMYVLEGMMAFFFNLILNYTFLSMTLLASLHYSVMAIAVVLGT